MKEKNEKTQNGSNCGHVTFKISMEKEKINLESQKSRQ